MLTKLVDKRDHPKVSRWSFGHARCDRSALRPAGAKWSPASRALLEVLRDEARDGDVTREAARASLAKREGEAIRDAAFGRRLKRLNDEWTRAGLGGKFASAKGLLSFDDGAPALEARIARPSQEVTLQLGVEGPSPRAMPERLWVLFSYAWQEVKAQHRAQLDLFERVRRILAEAPPPEFAGLPKIEIWRDQERLEHADGARAQIVEACDRAFLALVVMSRKYPQSSGCMEEFDRFVDENGANRSGKRAIIVPLNCRRGEVNRRFSDGLRLWLEDGGRTLVQSQRRAEQAKDEFAKKVALEIRKAAAHYIGEIPALEADRAPSAPTDRIAEFVARRAAEKRLEKTVTPFARSAPMGAEVRPDSRSAEGEGVDIISRLSEWAVRREGPRITALLGDFGMGKTVTCQKLTQALLRQRETGSSRAPLPIYLDLREIGDAKRAAGAQLEALMADMLRQVGEAPLDPHEVIRYARQNGALVIFDGLDEVTNKLTPAEAQALYRTILRIVPEEDWRGDRDARLARVGGPGFARRGAKSNGGPASADAPGTTLTAPPRKGPLLLVTCRTHYFADLAGQRGFFLGQDRAGLDADADVETWFMLPFNQQQIESYLDQTLGGEDGARARAMIAETYNLEDLTTRPILLKFFADTFRQLEQDKLAGATIDIGRLYEAFVDQTLARDEGKHVIPLREKKLLLAELALHLHDEGLNEIANDALDEWLTECVEAEPSLLKLRLGVRDGDAISRLALFLQDLRNATLLVRPGEKDFRFGHTSVREFFLAEALHRHIREGRLARLGESQATHETVGFLLARQMNGVAEKDRALFAERVPQLLSPGQPKALRVLAAYVINRAGTELNWPEIADFSGLDFTGTNFVASGGSRSDDFRMPPRAIWHDARLHDAVFAGLSLRGNDFSRADASSSFWVDCDFSGAANEGADFSAAEFRSCRSIEALSPSAKTDFLTGVACVDSLAGLNQRSAVSTWGEPADRCHPLVRLSSPSHSTACPRSPPTQVTARSACGTRRAASSCAHCKHIRAGSEASRR